jgi:hypothetical protein
MTKDKTQLQETDDEMPETAREKFKRLIKDNPLFVPAKPGGKALVIATARPINKSDQFKE